MFQPVRLAVFGVLVLLQILLFMPTLSLGSPGMLFVIALSACLATAVPLKRRDSRYVSRLLLVVEICIGVFFLAWLVSGSMLRADAYYGLLGEEKQGDFKTSLPPIDLQHAPLVSYSMAQRAAEKKLSEVPALGSQVAVGHLFKQLVRGEIVWVGFLEHRGFTKYLKEGSTPGYVVVSAHDPSKVELVTEVGGKKLALRFLSSAYFGSDQQRHLYFSGYASTNMTDFSPEVDEEGRPYMVATTYTRKVGLTGRDADGTLILDVQTGETKRYSLADTPQWVDRIQPEHFLKEQLEDRLHLIKGWFNPSDEGRLTVSGDMDLVYGSDGRAYYFAGHTSTAKEGGMVSFSLIDSRTKAATRYSLAGVTEKVAQQAAEGVFPEKKYDATNALPFMVDGVPTYVMALRDGTGIARSYAMVAIEDYQKVAVADTLAATARLFQAKMTTDKTRLDNGTSASHASATAKVLRKGTEVRGGSTSYLLMLEGQGTTLFAAGPDLSEELAVTREGDLVEVQFSNGTARVVGLLSLRNLSIASLGAASSPSSAASQANP